MICDDPSRSTTPLVLGHGLGITPTQKFACNYLSKIEVNHCSYTSPHITKNSPNNFVLTPIKLYSSSKLDHCYNAFYFTPTQVCEILITKSIGTCHGLSSCELVVVWRLSVISQDRIYHYCTRPHVYYRQTSDRSNTKSQNLNVSRLILQLLLPNPLKPKVKSRMKIYFEQRRQAMLQLHLGEF